MITAAVEHYARQARLAALATTAAERSWLQLDARNLDGSWPVVGRQVAVTLGAAQLAAAADAAQYVGEALAEQGIAAAAVAPVQVGTFVGTASDGRPLGTLLYGPVTTVKALIGRGVSTRDAMRRGGLALSRIVATQVQDIGRAAAGVGIVARPAVDGYVRMLNLPACSRCAILAGRVYRWSDGFARHPRCDCRHVPTREDVAGDLRTDPAALFAAGEVTGLSSAAAQAIADGADPARVVNAYRGTYVAGGRRFTREASTRGGPARLMPEELYRQAAGDRAEAIRLLSRFGYLRA